jgi:LacI family transcriptional regulator
MAGATIHHVAELANVSIKTVSRVLNGEPNVAAGTRDRVNDAVAALKYRPNISARSLAGSRSYLLGLLFDNPSADYVSKLQHGAIRQCRPRGYHIIVDWLDSTALDFAEQVHSFLDNVQTDGFILSPPMCDNDVILDALESHKIPYVRIAPYREAARSPSVNIDDAGAAFEMTEQLIDLGHTNIAFIKGHSDHGATHLRYGGYSAALRSRRIPLRQDRVHQGDFTPLSGVQCAEILLNDPDRPTAIFASNDDMALGVMLVANRLGLRVPQDLSVCGFDDTTAATLIWPQLTTVRQPISDMSAVAAEMLINRTVESNGRLLDFEIVVRGSTGPPAPN